MTNEQSEELRIQQLEESALRLEELVRELRSEFEALGDVLVVTIASLARHAGGEFLDRFSDAAGTQRQLDKERTARAIETLAESAREVI